MTTLPDYAELHCLSHFTFLRGASSPAELVRQAAQLGYTALAVTDECSLAGVVRAHVAAKDVGLKLIIGSEITLCDGPRLVLLAQNQAGYEQLSQLITVGRRATEKGDYRLSCADLATAHAKDCLALLLPGTKLIDTHTTWIMEQFPQRAWLAVELLRGTNDRARLRSLQQHEQQFGIPLVASGDVHMHHRDRQILQDVLTAIRFNTPVAELGSRLYPNAERRLRLRSELARIYPPALLQETLVIAERCTFNLDSLRYRYPRDVLPDGVSATAYLRQLTEAGALQRWPRGISTKVRQLIEHELRLIGELHYEAYFLTVYDIVRFAKERGILCQGRGSAANSAVCYCLGITEVDPSRMEVLFERFISKERDEPPDIDVDFEHERREEVIQYIYQRYGRERAALAATVITYQPKSAVRDVGKALGLDPSRIDLFAKQWDEGEDEEDNPENNESARLSSTVEQPSLNKEGRRESAARFPTRGDLLPKLVRELIGFPRHLSQHVGGFVIADGVLSHLVPIENATMPERTVIQWDKDDLEALGLMKVDILGLGMLSAIRRALTLVGGKRPLTLAEIPAEDPGVYDMLCAADTIGVFQVESRAQMAMLPRLKPRCFYDLVVEISLVRPGPIQGNMVHPYLRRRSGVEAVTYPNESVKGVLERTLGVPIFQEQVIKLAMVAAGFTGGEADQLRRAMAAWRKRGTLEPFEVKLRDGMVARGFSVEFAKQIFEQIKGFGEYGFPESHAASFALLVYASAWLKCYHPAAFTCALLNSQPMGFYGPSQLVQDARRHGVEVRPADVIESDWDCTLEGHPPALRLGLRQIKGLSRGGADRLVSQRSLQTYQSVADLARRAQLNRGDMEALAGAGALKSLAGNRHRARWDVLAIEKTTELFNEWRIQEATPMLAVPSEGENIVADYHSLGMTLERHPLALLRPQLQQRGIRSADQVQRLRHGRWVHVAGLVITRQKPGSANGVTFVTLEDETGVCNVVVWHSIAQRQRQELLKSQLLSVRGTVQREGSVIHIVAGRLENHSHLLAGLTMKSRDFR